MVIVFREIMACMAACARHLRVKKAVLHAAKWYPKRGAIMRVIRHGPVILGDRLFRGFLRSLRVADLAEATQRGYAGDLRRFRRWIEETRGARTALGRLNTVDLVNYRQHLIRSEKLPFG